MGKAQEVAAKLLFLKFIVNRAVKPNVVSKDMFVIALFTGTFVFSKHASFC